MIFLAYFVDSLLCNKWGIIKKQQQNSSLLRGPEIFLQKKKIWMNEQQEKIWFYALTINTLSLSH